jgi:hypothetical protein
MNIKYYITYLQGSCYSTRFAQRSERLSSSMVKKSWAARGPTVASVRQIPDCRPANHVRDRLQVSATAIPSEETSDVCMSMYHMYHIISRRKVSPDVGGSLFLQSPFTVNQLQPGLKLAS